MKLINFIILVIIFYSCKNNSIEKNQNDLNRKIDSNEFFFYKKNDSSISYNKDGKIQKIEYFKSKKDTIFVKRFNSLGEIKEEGFLLNGLKIKKWSYYRDNRVYRINEYFIIDNLQYTNQGWYINHLGDTIIGKGNFMNLYLPKLTQINKEVQFKIFLKNPIISVDSKVKLFVDLDPKNKINSNFSNLEKIKLIEIEHHPKNNHFTGTYLEFKTKGVHKIRGYLLEYVINKKDSIFKKERRIYFDQSIIVKDNSGNGTD